MSRRPPTASKQGILWLLAVLFSPYCVAAAEDPASTERVGRMITIRGSIDSSLGRRVAGACRAAVRDGVEILIFDIQAASSDFGPSLDLAKTIANLGGKVRRTVAFVNPQGRADGAQGKILTGHAVLVALACNEIVLSESAKMGDVYRDRADDLSETEERAYQVTAAKNGHDPWLARGMIDKNIRLVELTTPNGKRILPEDQAAEMEKNVRGAKSKVIKEVGERLLLDAESAKRYGLIRRTVNSRREAALAYGLPERTAADDELFQESARPVLLKLEGAVDGRMYQYVLRRIKQAQDRGGNLVFIQIDSKHGDLSAAGKIADAIDKWPARKIAWVPKEATGPATMILFACDELAMAPTAKIGDFRIEKDGAEGYGGFARAAGELAAGSKYPEAFVQGFMDPEVEVVEVQAADRPGVKAYKTAAEMEQPEAQKEWRIVRKVKSKQAFLSMTGEEAQSLDVAGAVCGTSDELAALYDVPGVLPVLQPGWVDALVDSLTGVGGTFFLLVIGMTCLYIEFQMPGFGVAGMISVVCFALFFWSRYLSDTANSLEIVMFLLGVSFLAVELFLIPGFTLTGLAGVGLIIGSLLLASQSFTVPRTESETRELVQNVATLAAAMVVFLAASITAARMLPRMPLFNRMVLAPPGTDISDGLGEEDSDAAERFVPHIEILGKQGVAVSPLRPSGRILLGDRFYDVVAQGAFVEPGVKVEVIEVYQNRIVVRNATFS